MLMSRSSLTMFLAFTGFVCVWPESTVLAQRTSGGVGTGTSISPGVTRGTGQSATGGTAAGAARTSTTGNAARTNSAGGAGRTGATGGGFGESSALNLDPGAAAAQGFGAGMVGRGAVQDGFIGNQGVGGTGGNTRLPQGNQFGNRGGAGFSGRGTGNFGGRGIGNLGGQNLNGLGGTSSSMGEFRPQLRISVQPAPRPLAAVRNSLSTSVVRLQENYPSLRGLEIDISEAGTVTLRGSVASESAKRVAVLMMKMEPGVEAVNDELTVAENVPRVVE